MGRESIVEERKLARLERACLDHDVASTFLGNFYGEGSSHPVSQALVPAVAECVEWLSVMDAQEFSGVLESMHPVFRDWVG